MRYGRGLPTHAHPHRLSLSWLSLLPACLSVCLLQHLSQATICARTPQQQDLSGEQMWRSFVRFPCSVRDQTCSHKELHTPGSPYGVAEPAASPYAVQSFDKLHQSAAHIASCLSLHMFSDSSAPCLSVTCQLSRPHVSLSGGLCNEASFSPLLSTYLPALSAALCA